MADPDLEHALASLPKFSDLDISALVSQLEGLIEGNKKAVDKLFASEYSTTWEGTVRPLEDYSDRLSKFFLCQS